MPNSSRPHGLQPTRLLHPWDFPDKSTGVGCHFLLQRIFPTQGSNPGLPQCRQTLYRHKGSVCVLVARSCPTLCDPMDCSPPGSSVHGIFPGKITGVGSLSLLQGIFPTQGSNPGLPHCRQILYQLSHQGWLEIYPLWCQGRAFIGKQRLPIEFYLHRVFSKFLTTKSVRIINLLQLYITKGRVILFHHSKY